ncbi:MULTISPECIES: PopC secretion inhibitor PopD [unclassified Corallococcus]|uniref:PopC secretion inhibitor PopD n=1 Tax=unclassified Corallococcus TaxID=2685029 RepID=UPI001A8DD1A3|nr:MULTISPECIES: hypothetical protein [unclassified Corallococcus]MBN9681689.1 hypothetical protein [Corallococcus sp. NCSPR001]WAS86740.1 hypothetical protein O0N60_07115 [Corallococcus sp. NCRR]
MRRKNGVPGEPQDISARMSSVAAVRPLPGSGGTVRALPGSGGVERDAQPGGDIDVTVMPREPAAPKRPAAASRAPLRSRADLYKEGQAENARFRESFMRWLEAHQLVGAVRAMSEPGGSLPMLHLRCAPRVLDQLRRAPEFEAGTMMPLEQLY